MVTEGEFWIFSGGAPIFWSACVSYGLIKLVKYSVGIQNQATYKYLFEGKRSIHFQQIASLTKG